MKKKVTKLSGKLSLNKETISFLNNGGGSSQRWTASYAQRCVSKEDSEADKCVGCSECMGTRNDTSLEGTPCGCGVAQTETGNPN